MLLYNIMDIDKVTSSYQIKLEKEEPTMLHTITASILQRSVDFFSNNNEKNPNIYVGIETLKVLEKGGSFLPSKSSYIVKKDYKYGDFVGDFFGKNVYLSSNLNDNEYFLGFTETELILHNRYIKLKQLIDKINATV